MYKYFLVALLICIIMQAIAWYWQYKTQNADVVDITWSLGIVICTIYYYFSLKQLYNTSALMLIFPAFWYLRLSIHLIYRYQVANEDSRYAYLRQHWVKNTQLKFFLFFMFQALLIWIFSVPAYWISIVPFELNSSVIIAFIIGGISIIGVTIADSQLYRFKKNNAKKVCDTGLWRYSRHPNYFFEWVHWLVYPILLIDTAYFGWSLIYPFLMLYFLLELTGIPFSEQQSLINRGDSYREYQNRTNKFFPWKPKTN